MDDAAGPSVGDVWRYPFLWSREAAQGETEGRKSRPVALTLLTRNAAGELEVLMVPITSQPPRDARFALPVPDIEKRRAGLDGRLRPLDHRRRGQHRPARAELLFRARRKDRRVQSSIHEVRSGADDPGPEGPETEPHEPPVRSRARRCETPAPRRRVQLPIEWRLRGRRQTTAVVQPRPFVRARVSGSRSRCPAGRGGRGWRSG